MRNLRLTIIVLCLPLLGCFEEPVRDHLHIAFAPGPVIVVTAGRDIASPATAGDNPAVEARMDEARSDLATGWDRWGRSFPQLDAIAERITIERRDGHPRRGIHSAMVDSFRPLERLLGTEGLDAFYEETGGTRELQLHPAGSGQATRQQRETVDDALTAWSEEVSAYLEAATRLYAYLDRAPDRAVPCIAHVFDTHTEQSGPIDRHEGEMVNRIKETMEPVADVLLIDTGNAYSLNELSRLTFDTFQGRLTVALDGPILEIEGLIEGEGVVERPPVDLWRALEAMVGQWLAPDLVTAMVMPGPDTDQPEPDPVAFASLPRKWAPAPDPSMVASELSDRLQPESVYRVRWRTRPAAQDDDEIREHGLEMLTMAEDNLPD